MTAFLKMHGLGNDFAIFDARAFPLALDAAEAPRHRRQAPGHRLRSGDRDGARQGRQRLHAHLQCRRRRSGIVRQCRPLRRLSLDRGSRRRRGEDQHDGRSLGVPDGGREPRHRRHGRRRNLDWREIPMAQAVDTASFTLDVPGFRDRALESAASVSMGNPHCVLFVDDAETRTGCDARPRDRAPSVVSAAHQRGVRPAPLAAASSHARLGARRRRSRAPAAPAPARRRSRPTCAG